MEFIYAQLNDENICVGISNLAGEVSDELLVRLENADYQLFGKRYEDGKWVEVDIIDVDETKEEA